MRQNERQERSTCPCSKLLWGQNGELGFNSIDSPQGGATAASPFVCRNVGGPPCLVGLHVQDCIAEGTWGNDIFNFGYDLASIFARAT